MGQQFVIPLKRAEPRYPSSAASKGIEGFVEIAITLREDGSVATAEVVDSRPPGVFDAAAKRAVLKWRYCPPASNPNGYPDPHIVVLTFEAIQIRTR